MKAYKKSISVLLLFFFFESIVSSALFGQAITIPVSPLKIDLSQINKKDSKGAKTGLWCERDKDWIGLYFYEKGVKNGLAYTFGKFGKSRNSPYSLLYIGNYEHGIPAGQGYYFNDNGTLQFIQTKTSKNRDFLKEAKWAGYYSPDSIYQCYITIYGLNGKLESEGWVIFVESPEKDSTDVGVWRYYTPKGAITKNKSKELEYYYNKSMK